jgi:ribonuclease R
MVAERDTSDRYLAAFLSDRVGAEFGGRISGVARFGAFVRLDETGADGLLPIRSLGHEYFHFDAEAQTLMGSDTGMTIGIGDRVKVKLAEAVPVTGGLILELLEHDGQARPQNARKGRRNPSKGRKIGQSKARKSKLRKKVARR